MTKLDWLWNWSPAAAVNSYFKSINSALWDSQQISPVCKHEITLQLWHMTHVLSPPRSVPHLELVSRWRLNSQQCNCSSSSHQSSVQHQQLPFHLGHWHGPCDEGLGCFTTKWTRSQKDNYWEAAVAWVRDKQKHTLMETNGSQLQDKEFHPQLKY